MIDSMIVSTREKKIPLQMNILSNKSLKRDWSVAAGSGAQTGLSVVFSSGGEAGGGSVDAGYSSASGEGEDSSGRGTGAAGSEFSSF